MNTTKKPGRESDMLFATKDHSLQIKLRYNVLFDSVKEEQLLKILEAIEEISLPAGSVIFEEESEGSSLYLIVNGTV